MFEDLIPELRGPAQDLVDAVGAAGLLPQVTSTRRSRSQQRKLYEKYLAGGSPFPAMPPGKSPHEYGYAFDMVTSPFDGLWEAGNAWVAAGGKWGGERDPVHFEYPGFVIPANSDPNPSLWDYIGWGMSATSLVSLLFELGYTVFSEDEAIKLARALHIDPYGRVF